MERVAWTTHPAKERPRDLALVAAVLFITLAATLVAFNSLFLAGLAAIIIIIGVSSFLFPTRYTLSDWGIEARGVLRTKARRWRELRRFEVGPAAALVSPLAQKSWLDRYRGIMLFFAPSDRERVVAVLNDQLGPKMPADDDDEVDGDDDADDTDTGEAESEDADGTI